MIGAAHMVWIICAYSIFSGVLINGAGSQIEAQIQVYFTWMHNTCTHYYNYGVIHGFQVYTTMRSLHVKSNTTKVFMSGCLTMYIITGGTLIHVWGHNFPEVQGKSQYKCKFDSDVVNATREALNHVTCRAPQHAAGDVILEISPDGVEYTNNDVSKFQSFMNSCVLPGIDDRIHHHVS